MAKEIKKDPSEMTVEEKLGALYKLQSLLSEIDKLKIMLGELPREVQDLEDETERLRSRNQKLSDELDEENRKTVALRSGIEKSQASITRYREQIDNVRNNREYDTLSKEIEFQTLEIELSEKKISEAAKRIEELQESINANNGLIADNTAHLENKKSEMDGIVAETKAQEENLRGKAKETEETIEPRLLNSFKRIRKNSRNGLGIVCVQRDACGGCFNKIPPQRQLDIRMHKKIIVCEYCGRILIDEELAGLNQPKPASETKAKSRRKKA